MLFPASQRGAIATGAITLTFRRWRSTQAVAGHVYRTAAGRIAVDTVDVVDPSTITEAEAAQAGFASVSALLAALRGPTDVPTYRVRFHAVTDPDPRDELAANDTLSETDRAEVQKRLDRLDHASPRGPWTAATLAAIASHPGVRAEDLARSLGRERADFKLDVRKLKALGLTHSLRVGYELSPRGAAFLHRS